MNISENIKRLRIERRLSQVEMSDKLGIAQNNYGKIERGITEITISRLYQIADILGVDIQDILGIDKNDKARIDLSSIEAQAKSLEKRIFELENWLDDKTKLSKLYKQKYEELSKSVSIALDLIIKEFALHFEIGEFSYMASKGVVKNLTAKEFKEHAEGNVVRTYADFNALIITEAQLIELFDLIFYSDLEKGNVLSHLIESVTESESFLENRYVQAYKKRRGF